MKITRLLELEKIPSGTPQQRKNTYYRGKSWSYPSATLEKARNVYNKLLRNVEKPPKPLTGAIKLTLFFLYGTKDKKKIKKFWKDTKSDIDNISKIFIDSLVRNGFIEDDARVVLISAGKVWNENSRIFFCIEELEGGGDLTWMLKSTS